VRAFLWRLDWTELEARYALTGRSPYAPAVVMGLVLYGIMKGVSSLRELEVLARSDVGAMWMTGGSCPDHSSIGRFLQLHKESLTEAFFEQLTRGVVKEVGSSSPLMAGDGTILEAASSRYRIITREAAQEAATKAESAAAQDPEDAVLGRDAAAARAVAEAAEERADAQRRAGDKRKTVVCSTEPEAAVLKGKKGLSTPAYVASVMADENRIIHALHIAQTDEQSAVEPMLDQLERVGDPEPIVLFDGAYATGPVVQHAAERNLNLLTQPRMPKKKPEYFSKQDFTYCTERDLYTCPAGQELTPKGRSHDHRRGTVSTRYAAPTGVCAECPLLAACIRAKTRKRRIIYRYDHDESMEALRAVMQQPNARAALRKRKAMVEPVFADLRGRQGLNRFRRFGLAGVKLEFALHAAAHNLRRLVASWARASRRAFLALFAGLLALLSPSGRPRGTHRRASACLPCR
jgi:transposase